MLEQLRHERNVRGVIEQDPSAALQFNDHGLGSRLRYFDFHEPRQGGPSITPPSQG